MTVTKYVMTVCEKRVPNPRWIKSAPGEKAWKEMDLWKCREGEWFAPPELEALEKAGKNKGPIDVMHHPGMLDRRAYNVKVPKPSAGENDKQA